MKNAFPQPLFALRRIALHSLLMVTWVFAIGPVPQAAADDGIDHPKIKWRFKTQGPIRSGAVIDGDQAYFASSDGRVFAIAVDDGIKTVNQERQHGYQSGC